MKTPKVLGVVVVAVIAANVTIKTVQQTGSFAGAFRTLLHRGSDAARWALTPAKLKKV